MAVVIIAMIAIILNTFLGGQLSAIAISRRVQTERQAVDCLLEYLRVELGELPEKQASAIAGNAYKFSDIPSDEITWMAKPGHGLLTTAASGDWRVTLQLRAREKSSKISDLGIRRRVLEGDNESWNWVPLVPETAAMEIRYFHPQLHAWVERWTEQTIRPSLIRFRIWKTVDSIPVEAIIAVPSSNVSTT